MSKKVFEENLHAIGIPDRASFDALMELTPDVLPYRDEMIEVLESIDKISLLEFIEAQQPTDLALALRQLRTD